ncbi:hypothetical protein E2C01_034745 [Portunus trituberculatus]|uniref:Chitin-binding type-2 domain-containing protein n=1 Tax=Portunus trituberculatus TaxID=210409 RepID=A0A5B7F1D1_PORTR|nr:hypothetical protein [Portunus trituberculatus]
MYKNVILTTAAAQLVEGEEGEAREPLFTTILHEPSRIFSVPASDYYWCSQGSPVLEQCPSGTLWSQDMVHCVNPSDVDTSTCNIP